MKTKPGIFPSYRSAIEGLSSWLLAAVIVGFVFWLGWQIYGAAKSPGNPWNKIAAEIGNVTKR